MNGVDPWLVFGLQAITATAVIAAAIITAATARGRQKRELDHAADRQKRELEHARELATLDDRRAVLDDAARLLLRMSRDVADFRPLTPLGAKYEFPESLDEGMTERQPIEARLIIRLGMDHPATEAFRDVIRAINEVRNVVNDAPRRAELGEGPEFQEDVEYRTAEMRDKRAIFLVRAKDAAS